MDKLSSKRTVLLLLGPLLCGCLLLAVTHLDFLLFRAQIISARQAIGHEMLPLFLGSAGSLFVTPMVVVLLIKKRWKAALLGVVSVGGFFVLVSLSAASGAAFLYAT